MKWILPFQVLILFLIPEALDAQIRFHKQYRRDDSLSMLQTFDSRATPDGGYVIAGLVKAAPQGNTYHPFVSKLNCKGEVQWQNFFGSTQSIANVYTRVIITKDSGYLFISNLGFYTNYNGLAVKLNTQGTILWQKTLNLSNGNDNINAITETPEGDILIAGGVFDTPDIGLVKLHNDGSLIWSKTYGSQNQSDEAYVVRVASDGNYLLAGRYTSMGTLSAFIMKTDTAGNMLWIKSYGDTLQHMNILDIQEMPNGDLVAAGSTTLLKPSFQSFSDNFMMRLTSNGDTLWTKIFYGSPDQFENVSALVIDAQQHIIAGVATASYPTASIVPNKNAVFKFDAQGTLLKAITYNSGSSHYTRVSAAPDAGFVLSGFSNAYTGPQEFRTLLLKLDTTLSSGCQETDITSLTTVTNKAFKVVIPIPVLGGGGTVSNNASNFNADILDSTLCASFPVLTPTITLSQVCLGDTLFAVAGTQGITSWHWNFGTGQASDTAMGASTQFIYTDTGSYQVTLTVSNGCDTSSVSQWVTVTQLPAVYGLGPDSILCIGASYTIGDWNQAEGYLWNTGDTLGSLQVTQSGTYILTADFGVCGVLMDTVQLTFISCDTTTPPLSGCKIWMPDAFSPNGDGKNDVFRSRSFGGPDAGFTSLSVYNRWGNRVFYTEDAQSGWDGTFKGSTQSSDTYFYLLKYSCQGQATILKGNVILVR